LERDELLTQYGSEPCKSEIELWLVAYRVQICLENNAQGNLDGSIPSLAVEYS